jgi:glutamyl-tRNA reductase
VKLLALGVDHRSAPTAIREALAFDDATRDRALDALAADYTGGEFAILSTCNRVEVYAAADDPAGVPEVGALAEFLSRWHAVPAETLAGHLVAHHDEAMVGHLFRVASSLESLVLGEGQILGQVRDAYKAAAGRKAVGPILHEVFQRALKVGKEVREATGMDRGKVSVASVAVDLAREVFDHFGDKTVLVIGAGKMADLTLRHLVALRPGQIAVVNRNHDRAVAAAGRWGGHAVPFEQLGKALIEADVVVSTTAADEPIVSYETYARVQRARRNRLALILDIAVPRDFDERVGTLDQVLLYNVDDLRAQVERNLQGRRKGIDPAQALIERETAACLAALRHNRQAGALLRQLGDHAEALRRRELEKLFAARPGLGEADREAIAHMALRLQNQFLHHPRSALRTAAAEPGPAEHPHPLLAAVRHLFGLAEPAPNPLKNKD